MSAHRHAGNGRRGRETRHEAEFAVRGWRWREQQREQQAELLVALCFLTTMGAGFLLLVLYALGGQTQLESVLLFLALAGFGAGLVIWSQRLIPAPDVTEPRHVEEHSDEERRALAQTLTEEAGVTRRRLLIYLAIGAVGGLLSALAIPILSLGPSPGNTLYVTSWRRGLRLMGVSGQPVLAGDMPIGSIATVFPEGIDPILDSDSAAVLLHVDPSQLQLSPQQAALTAQGFVAYSKLCTHVGCPVGLFVESQHVLVCPCHQSTFVVLRGAAVVSGPAGRPLPQLPIQLQADGTFVAGGDFTGPVGPAFWSIHQ
jgi:ubiquinol-cytochrome c reductase iron-sulfur subunit